MPELDGIAATAARSPRAARPRVLILTTFDLDEYVHEALRAGASGFLLKESPPDQLWRRSARSPRATRCWPRRDASADRALRRRRSAAAAEPGPGVADAPRGEVLALVARARSNAEIAAELYVSEATVKTHLARLLVKLGLRDRLHAVVFAYENGVVRPGS